MSTLLRPSTLTPSLRTTAKNLPLLTRRSYYSYETPLPPPYPPTETTILSAALSHVPTYGWTNTSLRHGARQAGYLDATTNLFPRAEFELILYHLRTSRLSLNTKLQFPDTPDLNTAAKVKALVMQRLRMNREANIHGKRWQEALGHMSLAGNIPVSLKELFLLSDEIWFLAGDQSVDASWYTKRATLASIYAATETFSTTDLSEDLRDTEAFLGRRLEEARLVGGAVGSVREWLSFQGVAAVNMARNFGVRI